MEQSFSGVVLRRRETGESDRQITLLTEEIGKIDVVAKGARKPSSRLAAATEPLACGTYSIAMGKQRRFVTQVSIRSCWKQLRSDFDRLLAAIAFAELIAVVAPYEQPLPELNKLLFQTLEALESHAKPLVVMAWAETQLLELTGHFPSLRSCVVSDAPITEAEVFISPMAGGYVSAEFAGEYQDRRVVKAEVPFGIAALAERSEPPSNLKFVAETLFTLSAFWRSLAEAPLPAQDQFLASVRSGTV